MPLSLKSPRGQPRSDRMGACNPGNKRLSSMMCCINVEACDSLSQNAALVCWSFLLRTKSSNGSVAGEGGGLLWGQLQGSPFRHSVDS